MHSNMSTLYVLKLRGGKYYVGKTRDVSRRFQEHRDGVGAAWTRKYAPVAIEKTMPVTSPFDEDKVTKEYMAMYGIDNVRGGPYVSEELEIGQRSEVQRAIWAAKDCCVRCGRKGHFVATCYARTTVDGYPTEADEDDEDDESEEDDEDDEEEDEEEEDESEEDDEDYE